MVHHYVANRTTVVGPRCGAGGRWCQLTSAYCGVSVAYGVGRPPCTNGITVWQHALHVRHLSKPTLLNDVIDRANFGCLIAELLTVAVLGSTSRPSNMYSRMLHLSP